MAPGPLQYAVWPEFVEETGSQPFSNRTALADQCGVAVVVAHWRARSKESLYIENRLTVEGRDPSLSSMSVSASDQNVKQLWKSLICASDKL